MNLKLVARLAIARHRACNHAGRVLQKGNSRTIVDYCGALLNRCHGKVDEETGIVKLPVVVDYSAAQIFYFQGRQPFECLFLAEIARRTEAVLAGQRS